MIVMRDQAQLLRDLKIQGFEEVIVVIFSDIRDALVRANEILVENQKRREDLVKEQRLNVDEQAQLVQRLVSLQEAAAADAGVKPVMEEKIEEIFIDIPDDEDDGQGEEEETEGPAGD